MRRAASLAILAGSTWALGACGEAGPPAVPSVGTAIVAPEPTPSSSAASSAVRAAAPADDKAIRFARGEWERILPNLPPNLTSWGASVDAVIQREDAPFSVRTESCSQKRQVLRAVVSDLAYFRLAGDETKLESPGDCRVVYFSGGMKREIEFILDADATELLFAWRIPEG